MTSKAYFDQVARRWDQMRQGFYSEAVREKALAVADVQAGRLAADIGAGTGFITAGLLDRGLRVIAVDQSEAMLDELRHKFGEGAGVHCRLGEAEALPIATGTLDYAFANMYLHHVESPPEAIREIARTLKPGGRLVITDLDAHDFDFLRREHHDRWLGFDRADIRRWLEAAGLVEVSVDCVGEECCTASSSGGQHASVSIFVACGQKPASG